MSQLCEKKKGFTLIEILVSVGILLIIASFFLHFVVFGKKSYEQSIDFSVLQEASRTAVLSMLDELQESRAINMPQKKAGTPRTSPVVVVSNSENEQIMYYCWNNKLIRCNINTNQEETIAKNIDEIHFTRLGDRLLAVRIKVTDPENERKSQIVTSFFLRNRI